MSTAKIKVGDQVRLSRKFPACMDGFKGRGKTAVVIEVEGSQVGLCFTQDRSSHWWYPKSTITQTGKTFSLNQVDKMVNGGSRELKMSKYDIEPNRRVKEMLWSAMFPTRKNPYSK